MSGNFRPLLAADPLKKITDPAAQQKALEKLPYPLLGSPKIDGIRVLKYTNKVMTRSLLPVRNKWVQECLKHDVLNDLDGEIAYGLNALDPMTFRLTTTTVMAEGSMNPFTWWVFDNPALSLPFHARLQEVKERVANIDFPYVKALEHKILNNYNELASYEKELLDGGFEGLMLRSPHGRYKYGRSTTLEGILLKLKRGQVKNGDAVVIGFNERMQNNNEATINELGLQERSAHKENLVGRGDLGSFEVRDVETGHQFAIGMGVGLDDALRREVWLNQEKYLNQIVRYEWFAYGSYDVPRFPKFVCFRDPADMG